MVWSNFVSRERSFDARYSPKANIGDEGAAGEVARDDDLQAQADENNRRMKFSYAVAEMISMAPHTKQLLLQVLQQ